MTSLFDDLKQGLQEAIDFANGNGPARVTTYIIEPVKELDKEEIKNLALYSQIKGKEPIALIDEKLLGYY